METLKKYYEKRHEAVKYAAWLYQFIRPWIPVILLVMIINAVSSVAGVGVAAINKLVVDAATAKNPAFDRGTFFLLVAVTGANILFTNGVSVGKTWLNERYAFSMKERFYEKILNAQWLPLSRIHSGDVMTRLTGDIDTVSTGMFGVLPALAAIVVQLISAFGLLYYYDPLLALFALCLGPLGAVISLFFSRIFARFQKQARENESAYRAFMQESVENLVISKSFCMEGRNKKRMRSFWEIRFGIIKKRSLAGFGINSAMSLIFSGGYLIAFGWSLVRLVNGEITYGTVTLLLTLVGQVQAPIQNLQSLLQQMISVLVSAGRIMEISEMPQERLSLEANGSNSLPVEKNILGYGKTEEVIPLGIRAKSIRFSYEGEDGAPVLENLNFDIVPGEIVGIVGSSGAGKTTIIRLILSLIFPQKGNLELYDASGSHWPLAADSRRLISYVPQGNTLMWGTIRENLLVGKEDASEEEMWEALECACAKEFVQGLPQGLDSRLLEKGGAVSEGQAQRIAIARAIIKPASVLILDEATASLDMETEKAIVNHLRNNLKRVTCIVVTHRPSLLDLCERTLKLENKALRELT